MVAESIRKGTTQSAPVGKAWFLKWLGQTELCMRSPVSMEQVPNFGLHELGVAKYTVNTRVDYKH
jgi:hypothetical protein